MIIFPDGSADMSASVNLKETLKAFFENTQEGTNSQADDSGTPSGTRDAEMTDNLEATPSTPSLLEAMRKCISLGLSGLEVSHHCFYS